MSDHADDLTLSRLLDGDLPTLTHEAVLDHLLHCPTCAARHEELVDVAATLRGLPAVEWTQERTEASVTAVATRRRPVAAGDLVPVAAALTIAVGAAAIAVWLGALSLPAAALGLTLKVTSAVLSLAAFTVVSELLLAMLLIALAAPLAAYPLARWR